MPEEATDPRKDRKNWGLFLGLVVLVTAYYEIGNRVFAPSLDVARRNARDLWEFQVAWGLDWEPAIQEAVDAVRLFDVPWLMVILVLFYVGPHFVLTFGFFAWAYWYRFPRFDEVRNVFVIFTVTSFGFQWAYPVAPPRLVPETGLRYTLADWLPVTGDSPTIMALTNPYAAFPSVHTGWAWLVAHFMVAFTRGPWRHLWWAYPGGIILSILATGNHFVIDILAAVPFLALASGADRLLRRPRRVPELLPEPRHSGQDAAFADRMRELAALPAASRSLHHPRNWVAGARLFIDYALTVPPSANRVASKVRHYPDPFEKRTIRMPDGTRLAAWLGTHDEPRPALIIIPGLFTSKDNAAVKKRALRVFHDWGWHVLTLDLRGNGESDRVPSTAGWKEAEDLIHVADWLREDDRVDGVGVYGESLAATAALLAAARAGDQDRPFADRGVLVVSGFADVPETIRLYTHPPEDNPELRQVVNFFTFLLRASGQDAKTFEEFHQAGSRHYGVDPNQAARDSSPIDAVARLRDPVLVLHSQDDALVPVAQVERLAARAEKIDRLGVWILPWGHHVLYEMASPDWYWRVLRTFYQASQTNNITTRDEDEKAP